MEVEERRRLEAELRKLKKEGLEKVKEQRVSGGVQHPERKGSLAQPPQQVGSPLQRELVGETDLS